MFQEHIEREHRDELDVELQIAPYCYFEIKKWPWPSVAMHTSFFVSQSWLFWNKGLHAIHYIYICAVQIKLNTHTLKQKKLEKFNTFTVRVDQKKVCLKNFSILMRENINLGLPDVLKKPKLFVWSRAKKIFEKSFMTSKTPFPPPDGKSLNIFFFFFLETFPYGVMKWHDKCTYLVFWMKPSSYLTLYCMLITGYLQNKS